MKIEYNNLYTHFILVTAKPAALIEEKNQVRIEKYITGTGNNNESKLYAIYANPGHVEYDTFINFYEKGLRWGISQ